MNYNRRNLLRVAGGAGLIAGLDLTAASDRRAAWGFPVTPASHFLNRISYGIRPVDLQAVNQVGIPAYLEQQLGAERVDDPLLRRKMTRYRLLDWDYRRLDRLEGAQEQCREALIHGMVIRAVNARAQLYERVCEFWSDHFNVASEGLELEYVSFQRDAIRRYAFTTFAELLFAVAKQPAMMYYLDNFISTKEAPNENYSRELMELHTLGVDGGYTEQDVREVARALTGWTVEDKKTGRFVYRHAIHDLGRKVVLGNVLPAGRGIQDGEDVLRILAFHPSTARYVSRKLAVRFVADRPPQSLIDKMVQTWTETGGQIKPVLRTLFLSPEFAASADQKLRRPLDLVIGGMRAVGVEFSEFGYLDEMLSELAQLPYDWHPPNGYPDAAGAWVNTGSVLNRWNASFELTDGALSDPKGKTTQLARLVGRPATAADLVNVVAALIFGSPITGDFFNLLVTYASDGRGPATPVTRAALRTKLGPLAGLMLSSPAYQWR